MSYLLLIVFLYWCLGIRFWGDYRSRCLISGRSGGDGLWDHSRHGQGGSEQIGQGRSAGRQPGLMAGVAGGLEGNAHSRWELGHSDNWGGSEGVGSRIHRRHEEGRKRDAAGGVRDKPEGLGLLREQRAYF